MLSGGSVRRAGLGGDSAVVTVSGHSVSNISGTIASLSTSGIRINTNGTIDEHNGNGYSQIDSGTDWIIPNGSASSTYECRIVSLVQNTGTGWYIQAAAEDTWVDMSSAREWATRDTNIGAPGIKDYDFTIEIRLGGSGGALDSGPFSLYSELESV